MFIKFLFVLHIAICIHARFLSYTCYSIDEMKAMQEISDDDFICEEYVNYTVACDANDDPALGFNPSCNNSFAQLIMQNFERALTVYSCEQYSRIWTCENCTASYKRWVCSQLFQQCNPAFKCPANFSRSQTQALPDCIFKTCQGVCYEVVQRCPQQFTFECPILTDIREYAPHDCNNMELPSPSSAPAPPAPAAAWLTAVAILTYLRR